MQMFYLTLTFRLRHKILKICLFLSLEHNFNNILGTGHLVGLNVCAQMTGRVDIVIRENRKFLQMMKQMQKMLSLLHPIVLDS